jgi:hypothetical protein
MVRWLSIWKLEGIFAEAAGMNDECAGTPDRVLRLRLPRRVAVPPLPR